MNSLLLTCLVAAVAAAPHVDIIPCGEIKTHVEWRELDTHQQENYLNAVKCLRDLDVLTSVLGGTSAYENMVAAHVTAGSSIYSSPAFLPWHRAFLAIHDDLLRTKCGYNDPMPYWDWTFDSQAPELSKIWDSFGNQTIGCVSMAKVGKLQSNYPSQHCVQRYYVAKDKNGNAMLSPQYSPTQMALILDSANYDEFRQALEVGPHNSIHNAIGGDMRTIASSPNDPIFFLHHRNIDRIWWLWQQLHPDEAYTYSGTAEGRSVKKKDIMKFHGLYPFLRVSSALDAAGGGMDGKLCYNYSNSIISNVIPFGGEEEPLDMDGILIKREAATKTPERTDREELFNLRVPATVEEAFLRANKYTDTDIQKLRQQEVLMEEFTIFVNSYKINFPATLGQLKSAKEKGVRPKTDAEAEAETTKNKKLVALFKEKFQQ